MKNLLFLFVLLAGFCSCHTISDLQIEKRHYRKGYYVHVRPHRYTEPVAFVPPERTPTERTAPVAAVKSEPAPAEKPVQPVAENTAPVAAIPPQETKTKTTEAVQNQSAPRSVKPVAQQKKAELPVSVPQASRVYIQNSDNGKTDVSKMKKAN